MADLYCGMMCVYGAILSLCLRERTGEGRQVLTHQVAGALGAQSGEFVKYEGVPETPTGMGDAIGLGAVHRYYQAKDGWAYLEIAYAASWQRLVAAFPGQLEAW